MARYGALGAVQADVCSSRGSVLQIKTKRLSGITVREAKNERGKPMSREGKLVKNTMILAIGTFFPKVAIFITLPLLTAYLSKAEYGTYDLVLTLVSLLLPAATLQIQSAAFRFLIDVRSDEEEKESIITNIYGFIVPVSVAALVIMYFVMRDLSTPIKISICMYFFCDIISNANKQIIRGLSNNTAYAIGSFIGALGQILLVLLLICVYHQGLVGGIVAICVAELLSALYLLFAGKIYKYISLKKLSLHKVKEMIAYSWPMVPNNLSQWVIHVSDRLVISAFLGVTANGIYAVAYKLPSILSFAQTTFNMSWQENATLTAKDNDVTQYYSSMFAAFFNIVAGGMAFLIGISPVLFGLLIRGDYHEAYSQLPILYMGILFYCLSSFWGGIYVAFKQTKAVATTTIIAAVINLAIDLITIHWIGLYAASISTLVSYMVLCILRLMGVQKIITLDYNVKHVAFILALLTVECVLSFLQNRACNVINFIFGMILLFTLNKNTLQSAAKKIGQKYHQITKPQK